MNKYTLIRRLTDNNYVLIDNNDLKTIIESIDLDIIINKQLELINKCSITK